MRLKISFDGQPFKWKNLLVAGGRAPSKNWFLRSAQQALIYCADSGVDVCYRQGILPELVLGDMDSCSHEAYQWIKEQNVRLKQLSPYKDDTDFKLLLIELLMCSEGDILCTGVWGGRFDHLYSIIRYIYTAQKNITRTMVMADQREVLFFLHPGQQLAEIKYHTKIINISLLPMDEDAVVSISGVQWPLQEQLLSVDDVYSISNLPQKGETMRIHVQSGCLGVYLHCRP